MVADKPYTADSADQCRNDRPIHFPVGESHPQDRLHTVCPDRTLRRTELHSGFAQRPAGRRRRRLGPPPRRGRPPVCMDDVSEEDKVKFDILPRNLREAIRAFEEDEFLQQVIGKTLSQIIINEKTDEWEEFSRQVTAWEVEKYLDRV